MARSQARRRTDKENSALLHTDNHDNPHEVTAEQLGLGNVNNVTTYSQAEIDSLLAGKANLNHDHDAGAIVSGTFADARISESSVVQHEAALTITEAQISDLDHYNSVDFDNDFATKTTDDLAEGSNLYYTQGRFDSACSAKSTTDLSEGTNLYYTQGRFDSAFSAKSTTDLSEGTNLYFTDERVDDRVSNLLVAGTDISLTYDDGANTLTINSTASDTQLTQEQVQDFAWNVLTGTQTLITVTYDDINNEVDFIVDNDLNNYDNTTSSFISDITGESIGDLSDVSITALVSGEFLRYNGTNWINDIISSGDLPSHTHSASDITSGTFADARIAESNVTQHQAAIDHDALTNFVANEHIDWTADQGATNIHVNNIVNLTTSNFSSANVSQWTNDAGYITATLTEEQVEDFVGGMLTGNTETLITVTYQDIDGTIDFVVDNDLSNYDNSTSGFITDYTVTEADVTQHETALTITESQISDLSHTVDTNLSQEEVQDFAWNVLTGTQTLITVTYDDANNNVDFVVEANLSNYINDAGFLTAEVNDLSSAVTWANVPDANITQSSVIQHQAALTITESQISDLTHYTSGDFDTDFAGKSTTDLSEGTNLYYTAERARDDVGAALVGGTDISVTIDDPANTITIAFTGNGGGASSLDDLSDVTITTVATGDFLRYNGTNFVNTTISSGDLPSHNHPFTDITGTITDGQHGNRGGGALHANATTSVHGFMSSTDKTKLNGIESGAEVNTVDSVFGRTGAVVAQDGDYSKSLITGLKDSDNVTFAGGTFNGDVTWDSDSAFHIQLDRTANAGVDHVYSIGVANSDGILLYNFTDNQSIAFFRHDGIQFNQDLTAVGGTFSGDVDINGGGGSPLAIIAETNSVSYTNGVRVNSSGNAIRSALTVSDTDRGRILLYNESTNLRVFLRANEPSYIIDGLSLGTTNLTAGSELTVNGDADFSGDVTINANLLFDENNRQIDGPRRVNLHESVWDTGDRIRMNVGGVAGSEFWRLQWIDDSASTTDNLITVTKDGDATFSGDVDVNGVININNSTGNRINAGSSVHNSPTLGSSTDFVLGVGNIYGISLGIAGTGRTWIQSQRFDGSSTTYNIVLNPSGGGVAIGQSSTSATLGVGGDATFSGDVTATDFIATSDGRIKSNETTITNALESIRGITPYHFDKNGERKVGYIAQNVEKYTENVVTQVNRDGYTDFRVMNMFGMQAYNTASIKELDKTVVSNEQRIKQLEKELQELRAA